VQAFMDAGATHLILNLRYPYPIGLSRAWLSRSFHVFTPKEPSHHGESFALPYNLLHRWLSLDIRS
jgi:hypothetical protein